MTDLVYVKTDEATTDSLMVAKSFGKRHDRVIRAIENLQNDLPENGAVKFVKSRYRDAKGLTQQEVADQLGLTNMAVSGWERGVRKPRMNTLVRLSAIYSISVDYLLTGEQKPENSEMRGGKGMFISDAEMERILQEEPDEKVVMDAVRRYRAQQHEDKDLICQLLGATLKATRAHRDLLGLYYQEHDNDERTVTAAWTEGRSKIICVTADSGIAMIRDILRALE